jgi:acetylornithine deacetylase
MGVWYVQKLVTLTQLSDPFKLSRDGDKIFGRGTTDCLGHVGLITLLLTHLATTKPSLTVSVCAVFICNEENSMIEGMDNSRLKSNVA